MTRALEVVEPGPLATVQDLGRYGWAHVGVPRAGALDRAAHRLANRLVGNDEDDASVEVTAGGLAVRAHGDLLVAVTGARTTVSVDDRPVGLDEVVRLPAGAVLRVERPEVGLRNHLAVAGGIAVDPVLGSRSTDVLAEIGPTRPSAGTLLPVGAPRRDPPAVDVAPGRRDHDRPVLLRPGPREDWLDDTSITTLVTTSWEVTGDSNRVGLRLSGPTLERRDPGRELPSEGLVAGAVQVPPNGQPVVFLADHPVTGGYPVVGVVADDDLDHLAQLVPGATLRFRRGR